MLPIQQFPHTHITLSLTHIRHVIAGRLGGRAGMLPACLLRRHRRRPALWHILLPGRRVLLLPRRCLLAVGCRAALVDLERLPVALLAITGQCRLIALLLLGAGCGRKIEKGRRGA